MGIGFDKKTKEELSMPDYQEMYRQLFNAQTEAIEILQNRGTREVTICYTIIAKMRIFGIVT